MKAIAFAIVCGAYLLVPAAEAEAWPKGYQTINGAVFLVCIFGFWLCMIFEGHK